MTLMELLPRCFNNTFSCEQREENFVIEFEESMNFSVDTNRLQITMDDVLVVQQAQTLDNRVAEASNQT